MSTQAIRAHLLDDPYLEPYRGIIERRSASATQSGLRNWPRGLARYRSSRARMSTMACIRLPTAGSSASAAPRAALPARNGVERRLRRAYPRLRAARRAESGDASLCRAGLGSAQALRLEESRFTSFPSVTPIIYEAHIGMAQEKPGVGTYEEFRQHILPRIVKAGYNTIQLMAIMEHPYYGSFGYHVSSFFAASSRFGTPEELKALVDAAHGAGLAVIMDIVHSHSVQERARRGSRSSTARPYPVLSQRVARLA
jgi:hypothetical protein